MNSNFRYINLTITSTIVIAATASFATGRNNNDRLFSPPILIVDLDGDGFETIPLKESNTYFDMGGDGLIERTEWIAPDDGILLSSTLTQKSWPVYTALTWLSHAMFNFIERANKKNYVHQQSEGDQFYIGVEPGKPMVSRFGGPRMSIAEDKNSDGSFEDRHVYNGYIPVTCQGQRLTFNAEGNMVLDCKDGKSYAVKEARFEYEDSNVKQWNAYCKTIRFYLFSAFLSGIDNGDIEKDEYSFFHHNNYQNVIMCLNQGFKPEIPNRYKTKESSIELGKYLKRLEAYKPGMFLDRVQ